MNSLMKHFPRPRTIGLALSGALLLAGCGHVDGTHQLPMQASAQAEDVDWVFYFIYWLNVFYFVHIMAIMGYFMWRYRRRPGVGPEESPHHSTPLEIAWSIPPVILVLFMFWFGFEGYADMRTPPQNSYKIEATAKKWSWAFTYPNGAQLDVLHVPMVDAEGNPQPVQMLMESEDVLHAFYIPEFRVKQDIVPGRVTTLWFTAIRPGGSENLEESEYKVFCAEYCGTQHSSMWAPVVVHETWEAFQEAINRPQPVETVYKIQCASCHSLEGSIKVGPSFRGLYGSKRKVYDPEGGSELTVEANEEYIRESVLEPGKYLSREGKEFADEMPKDFSKKLKPGQLDQLVEFIKAQAE